MPEDLVLNNTVQITYNSSAPPAAPWIVEDITTFNDTELTPLVHEDLLGEPDVEIVLHAYFDVRPSIQFTLLSVIPSKS